MLAVPGYLLNVGKHLLSVFLFLVAIVWGILISKSVFSLFLSFFYSHNGQEAVTEFSTKWIIITIMILFLNIGVYFGVRKRIAQNT